MSLSTLNINHLLEQITDRYIAVSDYATLRNSCIQLSPVSAVTTEIQKELSQLLAQDKQNTATQLTVDACKKQIQHDLKEKEVDHQESQTDLELVAQLEHELLSTQVQKRLIGNELNEIEEDILRHESYIKEISRQIALTPHSESTQHTHTHPESTQHTHTHPEPTQHTHTHPEPTQHTHTHPEPTQHTHTHPESTQHTHTHPEPTQHTHTHPEPTQHTHPNMTDQRPNTAQSPSDTGHHHAHERESLEFQKNTLSQKLKQLEGTLRNKRMLAQEQQRRIEGITTRLTTEFPEKQKQRNDRAKARTMREQARIYDEATENQLSIKNYRALQQSIIDSHEKLHKMQHQLMQNATEMSYKTFLIRLPYLLQSLTLKYQEKEALRQIISAMENYLLTQAEKYKQISIRHSVYRDKETHVQDLNQKESRVAQLKKANPQLHAQNQALEIENKQLKHTIEERGTYRDYLLKIGLFSLLCSGIAVGGGFLGMYMMPMVLISLCFAPAAVISFITVGIFLATLAYTLKNNSDSNALEHNKITMQQNITAISKQSGEIISLEQEIIPSIKEKISEAEKSFNLLDKKINNLQQQEDSLLHQAKQIVVTEARNIPFFGGETIIQSTVKPTAPQLEHTPRNTLSC
ncbi:substrate of the Dot/Icm secretion system [Legionella sainthelensi]|uniref:Substrate of the Dot/Icm secretion system n=1 Tax=Legionella sainthelensi TaxID=28087 RepID=A0A0W0YCD9_9GAMM|nr:hypothetical protein [Legionella sainthelensi]KTD54512.1 substrate of the Dot/Icm secretion system [Legionella sainthelensi]VEH33574.1 substrate of the Dot/Icm secretion system [Legionella sainthelensi]